MPHFERLISGWHCSLRKQLNAAAVLTLFAPLIAVADDGSMSYPQCGTLRAINCVWTPTLMATPVEEVPAKIKGQLPRYQFLYFQPKQQAELQAQNKSRSDDYRTALLPVMLPPFDGKRLYLARVKDRPATQMNPEAKGSLQRVPVLAALPIQKTTPPRQRQSQFPQLMAFLIWCWLMFLLSAPLMVTWKLARRVTSWWMGTRSVQLNDRIMPSAQNEAVSSE